MIGNIIRQVRNIKGIRQKELAFKCGISPVFLNYIENNKRNPSPEVLKNLSIHLDIPISILNFLSYDEDSVKFKEEYNQFSEIINNLLLKIIKESVQIYSK